MRESSVKTTAKTTLTLINNNNNNNINKNNKVVEIGKLIAVFT